MARHPTARRVHHDAADPDDAFIAQLLELVAWVRSHARVLTTAGLLLVLAAAAGLYYRNVQRTIRTQAETTFATVRQTAASGNAALAIRDLKDFVRRFDGTGTADEARLLLAQTYLGEGQPDTAIAVLEPLAGAPDEPLGASAAFLAAAAHEAASRPDRAEALYLEIAEEAPYDFQRQDALDAAARIRLERGDAAGAAELLERLVALAPEGSPERGMFELRLSEARTRGTAAR